MSVLSVVIPSYNEEPLIRHTAVVLGDLLTREKIAYELIFVDDGSKDRTWDEIAAAREKDPCVHGVRFSRNFGKEAAIFAGLAQAEGSCAAVMDCDLQHPPETLVEMYRLWEQGYEVIEGVKRSRGKESALHAASAGMFYRIMSRATKVDMSRASDFKLMDRKAVDAILSLPDIDFVYTSGIAPAEIRERLRKAVWQGIFDYMPGGQILKEFLNTANYHDLQ